MNKFKKWFNRKYGEHNPAIASCMYPMRSSWLACKKEVLRILNHPKIDTDNLDYKYIKNEIEKL